MSPQITPARRLRAAAIPAAVTGALLVPAAVAPAAVAQTDAQTAAPTARSAQISLGARTLHVLRGDRARVTGTLYPRAAGRRVTAQIRRAGTWRSVVSDHTDARGRFTLVWRTSRLGSTALRLRFAGDRTAAQTARSAGRLTVYRTAYASWYALYGNPLACGGRASYSKLGVAHKTLPCGTKVTIRYRGRSVTVPVVDRGPYSGGRDYDLTGATARRLGFNGVGRIWATR